MAKIQFCPRCGEKTDAPVCPICFTRFDEQPQQRRELTPDEMQNLPPFECPRCHTARLMTDGSRYYCASCGVAVAAPQRMIDPLTENPDYAENPVYRRRFDPMTGKTIDNGQTVSFTPPQPVAPKAKKRGWTRGKLAAVLCGIVVLFAVGGCIALAIDGFEKQENNWQEIFEDVPGFEEDFFSGLPGFEDYFGNTDPFEQTPNPDVPQDNPFESKEEQTEGYDWNTGAEIAEEDYYPNGCSEAEYGSLKSSMTYAQISAIIGGDAGNWYDTVDKGVECTVFQWITEDSRGIVSVKMVDGKAEEFHVESGS